MSLTVGQALHLVDGGAQGVADSIGSGLYQIWLTRPTLFVAEKQFLSPREVVLKMECLEWQGQHHLRTC